MQEMSRKNKLFTDSVIRRMTRVALSCGAINLAQGFPDFDPPKALTDRLAEVSALGPHQYPITMGAPNFRQALARKAGRFMGRTLDPETDMVVTIGSTEAMVDTIFALTNPGDKIIMFSPYFENYRAQAIMADCEPIFVPLVPPAFNFDANVLEDAFKQGAKAILICNPSNPSGKVFTYDELKLISELCIKYDAFAIMDEVYEHIVYEGHKHIYMNSLPGMWERTVSCSSLSKTYSITGWRLGYAIAPKPIMDRIKQYHDFNTVGAPSPLMEAAVVGLDMPDSYYKEFGDHYAHMKKLFTDGLKQIGIPFTDPQGAYFVLADIGPYLRKGESDVDFCLEMAEKVGVACVPGTSFFNENVNNIVRVHFAKKDETLYEALDRLSHLKENALRKTSLPYICGRLVCVYRTVSRRLRPYPAAAAASSTACRPAPRPAGRKSPRCGQTAFPAQRAAASAPAADRCGRGCCLTRGSCGRRAGTAAAASPLPAAARRGSRGRRPSRRAGGSDGPSPGCRKRRSSSTGRPFQPAGSRSARPRSDTHA